MNILIIGSGAREHAIAWKLKQSPRVMNLFVAPGNAGTARLAQNIPLDFPLDAPVTSSTLQPLVSTHDIDFVVIGPEAPLAAGWGDAFRAADVPVFAPNRNAAEIEASKG